uniref:VHS domain-containing protein n=1 Tax=Periophthalmus magnuspinnatus TaxID=409849 RepID=A0A3B4B0J8_9GOBI
MEFFLGNPFSTPVGQLIEKATSSSLPSEDWALNMEICDIVNAAEEGPRDAVRAIKKRIVGNKNFKEVMMTLTVLETCVKNCGYRFHVLVTTRDFIEGVLVRSIIPRNNPPAVLHDRVLSIIQAWADAFRSSPDLTGVVSVYEDLRRKGLEFPTVELEGYSSHQNHKEVKTWLPLPLLSFCANTVVFLNLFFSWGPVPDLSGEWAYCHYSACWSYSHQTPTAAATERSAQTRQRRK